ncbi:Rrf2 family transcriptional regulator [Paraherbaspirillum soli]|uniref:Rrf2 family transcriptional regulator n=1 Tax=Paraherbaspirillum soli TaxID=631222 RepID=A0ABW0MBP8_9BURK
MRLTTKGRYAVTAMLDLALHSNDGPVTANDISRRQRISRSYLEHLFAKLHRDHLVESLHGPGGGYFLARELHDISVADILQAVDESIEATQCLGKLNCHDGKRCMTHELWANLNTEIVRYLASVRLSQLVEKHQPGRAQPLIMLQREQRSLPLVERPEAEE